LAVRDTNPDVGSTRLGMGLPPNRGYAKIVDVSGAQGICGQQKTP
jgi:hypothetical protein